MNRLNYSGNSLLDAGSVTMLTTCQLGKKTVKCLYILWCDVFEISTAQCNHVCCGFVVFNTLRLRENGRHFPKDYLANDNFKYLFVVWQLVYLIEIVLKLISQMFNYQWSSIVSDKGLVWNSIYVDYWHVYALLSRKSHGLVYHAWLYIRIMLVLD